jgi:hypothetical protein
VQRHGAGENPPFCGSGAFVEDVVGVCTNHEAFHKLFGTDPGAPPYPFSAYPDGPAISNVSTSKITATAAFDGWGYVHLFSNTPSGSPFPKFLELDTYAISEAMDPTYATGYGDLTVHEVATDPQHAEFAYLSYYAGGLRSLEIVGNQLVEVGSYIHLDTDGAGPDVSGNNFWGVEAFVRDGCTYIAASDRDSGLWLFRNTDICP